jgi:hypothetical protein
LKTAINNNIRKIFAMIKTTGIPRKLPSNMVSVFKDNALTSLLSIKKTILNL